MEILVFSHHFGHTLYICKILSRGKLLTLVVGILLAHTCTFCQTLYPFDFWVRNVTQKSCVYMCYFCSQNSIHLRRRNCFCFHVTPISTITTHYPCFPLMFINSSLPKKEEYGQINWIYNKVEFSKLNFTKENITLTHNYLCINDKFHVWSDIPLVWEKTRRGRPRW